MGPNLIQWATQTPDMTGQRGELKALEAIQPEKTMTTKMIMLSTSYVRVIHLKSKAQEIYRGVEEDNVQYTPGTCPDV
jgi:hypothetical protein